MGLKKECKRRIDFENISGITISKQTDEFIIHAMGSEAEYDYYYVYSNKRKLIESISKPYKSLLNRDLVLCEMDQKSLRSYIKKNPNIDILKKTFDLDI